MYACILLTTMPVPYEYQLMNLEHSDADNAMNINLFQLIIRHIYGKEPMGIIVIILTNARVMVKAHRINI